MEQLKFGWTELSFAFGRTDKHINELHFSSTSEKFDVCPGRWR